MLNAKREKQRQDRKLVILPQVDAARVRAKATAPGIMPGQSPAGRSGAAAPRDQPAPPPTGDGAPPPAKQGSAGAEGAEIARPTDSASEGPRPSDSLPWPWRAGTTSRPHRITLKASADNKQEPEVGIFSPFCRRRSDDTVLRAGYSKLSVGLTYQ